MTRPTRSPIRVLIADDHAVVRHGLQALIESEPAIRVVAEAEDARSTLAEVRRTRPDVVMLDLSMPQGGGLAVLESLAREGLEAHVLVLTMHDDPAYIRSAFAAGARGYLVKSAPGPVVLKAIHAVARGERYVDSATTRSVVGEVVSGSAPLAAVPLARLTDRERQVLQLLAEGYTNAEVGARLGISVKTAETHRSRLSRKLGADSRADLVRYALNVGLLTRDT